MESEKLKCPNCETVGSIVIEERPVKQSDFAINEDGYVEWGKVLSEEDTGEGYEFACTECFETLFEEELLAANFKIKPKPIKSLIVEGKGGYEPGLYLDWDTDAYQFMTGNENYIAFRTDDGIFFGNASHGKTHKVVINGKEELVYGFRWVDTYKFPSSSIKAILPEIQHRLDALPVIPVKEGVSVR